MNGTDAPPTVAPEIPAPQPPVADAPPAMVTPPPAGRIVISAERTEREVDFQAQLDAERASHARTAEEKKQREVKIAELEDALHQQRQIPQPPPKQKKIGAGWFEYEE